jgi:hypothetical protein
VRKLREWREVIFRELLILGFISAGVLVLTDWVIPETRLRGVGLLLGMVSCTAFVVGNFRKLVVSTWDAGGRAERRRAELEAASQRRPLAVVRDGVRR